MPATSTEPFVHLPADSNQALGIARYAIDFVSGKLGDPDASVLDRVDLFHTDAALCGLSALALRTNAPTLLREEALTYPIGDGAGATVFGSDAALKPEKAIVANSSAVREWDSNGTNFGYNKARGNTAGEFGHNDFYPVVIAACQMRGLGGPTALRAMVCLDEIRGRLAEVFSLKSYKIDHVVHGAIASAAVFGALMGASEEQIESAIGMTVAHYIPWRAIRAGKQLSDSKGASAAISTEAAVLSTLRSMRGFMGPRDIFRNPEAVFRYFEPTASGKDRWTEVAPSPFDLHLSHSGDDFAVMGMHFKLGLYEHQSAGALQAVIDLVNTNPEVLDDPEGGSIESIMIRAYEPAFGIIGNPAKMDPRTRQSADHSMAFIVSRLIRKALDAKAAGTLATGGGSCGETWKQLMLSPYDYAKDAVFDETTRSIMKTITFEHGGDEYDKNYPDGIPTSVVVTTGAGSGGGATHDSGMVMYPAGHARNTAADLEGILDHKFRLMAGIASDAPGDVIGRLRGLGEKSEADVKSLHAFELTLRDDFEDA